MPGPKSPYDWPAIQDFYDSGHSYRDVLVKFGICSGTLARGVKRGWFKSRGGNPYKDFQSYSAEQEGVRGGWGNRWRLKTKILKEELLPYKCEVCGISEWRGQPITLRLDHKDGNNEDHRLSNLQFICPNCDSQQPTYCHRNRRRVCQPLDSGEVCA